MMTSDSGYVVLEDLDERATETVMAVIDGLTDDDGRLALLSH
jgi:hypothetical protein